MKKIVTFICIACIGILIAGCASTDRLQGSEIKTVEIIGTKKLKPLELPSGTTPSYLRETKIECELPKVPETIEAFKATNIKESEGTFKYRAPSNTGNMNSPGEPLQFEKASEVAKEFLIEKGVKVSNENVDVRITGSLTYYDEKVDKKVDALNITLYAHREINGLKLYDGDIIVSLARGYNITTYINTKFDVVSKGYYKIISPKEAVDLIPKYEADDTVLSSVGNITDINLCYYGFAQDNIQPVYVIKGYTDNSRKDDKFRIIMPAIKQ